MTSARMQAAATAAAQRGASAAQAQAGKSSAVTTDAARGHAATLEKERTPRRGREGSQHIEAGSRKTGSRTSLQSEDPSEWTRISKRAIQHWQQQQPGRTHRVTVEGP